MNIDNLLFSINEIYDEELESKKLFNEGIFQKYKEKKEAKKKEKEAKSEQERYNRVKKAYMDLAKFLEYPFNFGWENSSGDLENMFYISKFLKISESQFISRIKKIKFKDSERTMFDVIKDDFYGERDCKNIKELIDKAEITNTNLNNSKWNWNMKVIEIGSNDDNIDFIGQDGKIYSMQTDDKLYEEHIYSNYFLDYAFDDANFTDEKLKEYITKADQELGYYILSQPPKGVQKKKLPL